MGKASSFVFLTAVLFLSKFANSERIQCNDGIDKLLTETNKDIKSRSPLREKNKEYCNEIVLEGAYTLARNGDIFAEKLKGNGDCYLQDFNIVIKRLNFTCELNMDMIDKAIEQRKKSMISKLRRSLDLDLGDIEEPSGAVLGNWNEKAGRRTQCNEGIDELLQIVNEDIKSRSPLNRTDKPYCDVLSLEGCYTIIRNGDIYGEHIDGPDDCYEQDLNIILTSLNFTCDANMVMIMEEIQRQSSKFQGRRKRAFDIPMDDLDQESAFVFGYWNNVCINGKLKLCKNNDQESEASKFNLCSPDIENCLIECGGDNEKLNTMCAQGDMLEKIKNMMSSIVQLAAQEEIRNSIKNGPSQMVKKFNCDYVTS